MGNNIFCDVTNEMQEEFDEERNHDDDNQQEHIEFVKEGGVSGLNKFGFEYRTVHCSSQCRRNHNSNTTTTTSSSGSSSTARHSSCDECTTSLFHIESGDRITSFNWKSYWKDTIVYGHIAKLCQEITQDHIQKDYGLQFHRIPHSVPNYPSLHMLASQQLLAEKEDDDAPIFLVLPGKGVSRAGILSTKHLVESSIEQGSAKCHIEQAQHPHRNYHVVLMDSNAWGRHVKKECLHTSLSYFVQTFLTNNNNNNKKKRTIYILAHSASGGHLVRYLMKEHDQTFSNNNTSTTTTNHNNNIATSQHVPTTRLFDHIQAIAFTDSTHNIQWLNNNNKNDQYEPLSKFLQSDKCVYIKYNSEHPSDTFLDHKERLAGENYYCENNSHSNTASMTTAQYYHKRRFGSIPTVWAGTPDHSLMCWVSRHYIWEFFDQHHQSKTNSTPIVQELEEEKKQDPQDEYYP